MLLLTVSRASPGHLSAVKMPWIACKGVCITPSIVLLMIPKFSLSHVYSHCATCTGRAVGATAHSRSRITENLLLICMPLVCIINFMGNKVRAGLTIDSALWDDTKKLFSENPELGSISAIVEQLLSQFMQLIPEPLRLAKSGDLQAAAALAQMGISIEVEKSTSLLTQIYKSPSQEKLFPKGGDSRSKKRKKSV